MKKSGCPKCSETVRKLRPVLHGADWLSEYGLSSETCGSLWAFVTLKATGKKASGLELIEVT